MKRQNIGIYNNNWFDIILILVLISTNEIYNNPNLHSEEQDELEIPDSI